MEILLKLSMQIKNFPQKNMNNNLKFGQFISEKRQKLSMESQELAKVLGMLN